MKVLFPAFALILLPTIVFAQNRIADLVVINAKVRTMSARNSTAEAFVVSENRILSVGKTKSIRAFIGPATRVIDARGKLVLPGFNDAHVHFMGMGNTFSSIDLRNVGSSQEMIERIAHYIRFLPKGRWILGGTWNNAAWKLPGRRSIDAVAPDNPVFLYRADGRSAVANSLAIKLAGLKDDGVDVDRDASGEATGVVRGRAMTKIRSVVPASHTRKWLEIAETATNYAASFGVTSVQDMDSDDNREIYLELQRSGKLKTRVYDCIDLRDWKKLVDRAVLRDHNEMVRDGCLKGFSDGDQESAPKLLSEVLAADKAGLQLMVHAIGRSANNIVLGVFEQMIKTNGPRDRRFRIEHAYDPSFADLGRFAGSNIIASMQPYLFHNGTGGYYATLLRQNAVLAFGSDAAMTDLDPLLGIHSAVNTGTDRISVYDAVRAYTFGSAFAEFREKQKGTIEPGKLADFVILSDDIFTIEPVKIRDVKVAMTVVDGKVVYERL